VVGAGDTLVGAGSAYAGTSGLLKNLSSASFDVTQDEWRGFEIVDDFPFMLRVSKHPEAFFSNLLVKSLGAHCRNLGREFRRF